MHLQHACSYTNQCYTVCWLECHVLCCKKGTLGDSETAPGVRSRYVAKSKGEAAVWFLLLCQHCFCKSADVTAYDVASIEGHTEVCDELEAHGYQSLAPPTEVRLLCLN